MELTIENKHKIMFSFENTKHKLGIRIWGDRKSFHELHELLVDCWDCSEDGMTLAEECSYIGIISYFSYSVRHAFMGDRLVKLDGKPLMEWSDEMFQLFEKEQNRFTVGMEYTWPQMLFIMAAWWECLKHHECPLRILPVMREFTDNIEMLLQPRSKVQYPDVKPYIHGAVYAANPYLMHTMQHVDVLYLYRAMLGRMTLKKLAEVMQYAAFGTYEYDDLISSLKSQAKKIGSKVEELSVQVDESVYEVEL